MTKQAPPQWAALLRDTQSAPWSIAKLLTGNTPRVEFHYEWAIPYTQELDQDQASTLINELELHLDGERKHEWKVGRKLYQLTAKLQASPEGGLYLLHLENWKEFERPVRDITYSRSMTEPLVV